MMTPHKFWTFFGIIFKVIAFGDGSSFYRINKLLEWSYHIIWGYKLGSVNSRKPISFFLTSKNIVISTTWIICGNLTEMKGYSTLFVPCHRGLLSV